MPAGAAARAGRAESAPEPSPALSLAGRRVLVIDDERDIREGMTALLESWHCEATGAGSADQALALLASKGERPEVVICDYRLPDDVTGTVALARLEEHFGVRIPAVIVTGDTSADRIREMKQSGRPLLFKPVMAGKLRAVLTALTDADRAAR